MAPQFRGVGRPRTPLPEPSHTLTLRVRRLIDYAHDGSVRDAGRLTGIPYPTLNDLYIGRTVNPQIATLEMLSIPYGIEASWLLTDENPAQAPRRGRTVLLPPHAAAEVKRRSLRKVQIPFTAWSMYEVFSLLEIRLIAMPVTADRPIVAEAQGDALPFRLATFLFQPLLAAEKTGEINVIPSSAAEGDLDDQNSKCWIKRLRLLGDMWQSALPELIAGNTDSSADV